MMAEPPGLCVGDAVRFRDGTPFGVVERTAPLAFQVSTGELICWVRNEAIARRSGAAIELCCSMDELHGYAGRTVRRPVFA